MAEDAPITPAVILAFLRRLWRSASVPLMAVVVALLVGALIIRSDGASPIAAYRALWAGAFGDAAAIGRTMEKATPLVFSGLAVAFAFKAGLFNIGGQGQLILGAITAGYLGFAVDGLPPLLHVLVAVTGGGIIGGLFGAIPGALKAYTGAHEVITTIMLNFVAINLTDFLANGPWKDPSPTNIIARTPKILPSAEIPRLGDMPLGFFLAIAVSIFTWWLLWRTTVGYEIRTVGLNPSAARYAGMRVAWITILTMLLSGVLAGLGGSVETLGIIGRFEPGFNTGLGFDGITVALLGKTSPIGVIPAAILVGMLKAGSSEMQFAANVNAEITNVLQALMLFFVSADIIVRWLLRRREADEDQVTLSSGWGQQ